MGNRNVNGYEVIAQYGNFLVVFAPHSDQYYRSLRMDYHDIAHICHTGKRWIVNFRYWAFHPLEDAVTLVESILHFQKVTKPKKGGSYLIVEQYKDFSKITPERKDKVE